MDVSWEYLSQTPIGEHWADRYIDLDYIASQAANGVLGVPDPGLGPFRFITASGTELRNLLGTSEKILKKDGTKVKVRVIYLSPSKESDIPLDVMFPPTWKTYGGKIQHGVPKTRHELETPRLNPDTCPYAGLCPSVCIITAGNLRQTQNARARYAKTWFFYTQPIVFLRVLLSEILIYAKMALISGEEFYARLNGTSDIFWERYIDMDRLTSDVDGMRGFYDYTKAGPLRYTHYERGSWSYCSGVTRRTIQYKTTPRRWPKSYHITYSIDEKKNSSKLAKGWLKLGAGIAIVILEKNVKKLLKEKKDYPFLVDGDATDYRFSDPQGAIVLLKRKGNLKTSGEGKTLLRSLPQARVYIDLVYSLYQADQLPLADGISNYSAYPTRSNRRRRKNP